MKKILGVIIFVLLCAFSLVGCGVNHNDGVCDASGCNVTFGVIRYDTEHELCISHAIQWGFK